MRDILVCVVLAGFVLIGIKAAQGETHPKPVSQIEFGIEKHGGLHYVNGGFNKYTIVKGEKIEAGYNNLYIDVDIKSLWTWQEDTASTDDPNRTADLLSDDWFDAEKFPTAHVFFKFLPLNNAKVSFDLRIKGIQKTIIGEVKDGYLLFKVTLKDFKIDNSWKRIFAGNHADVKVKLVRSI